MKSRTLYFAVQSRLHRDSGGNVRTGFGYARFNAWLPYLAGVDRVVVIARVSDQVSDSGFLVEGPGVTVMPVPFYQGPADFARKFFMVRRFIKENLVDPSALYGARVPNVMASLVQQRARQLGAIYFPQIVGDPEEVLKSGVAGAVGRLAAKPAKWIVARQVSRADAVIYVTRSTLQSKYPASAGVPTLIRSNVELHSESFAKHPRDYSRLDLRPLRLVAVGSQEQAYKGHDVLITSLALLRARGIKVEATIIGDGRYHASLLDQAKALGVGDVVSFVGHVAGPELVRKYITGSHIFVMPSLTEGLPRALIEAMASGTLSIGSRVGGIPELLSDDAMFAPGDAGAIVAVVERLLQQPSRMNELAGEQFKEARLIGTHFSGEAVLGEFIELLSSRSRRST